MEVTTLYNPAHWTLLFDTFSVQGFGDGDAIALTPSAETVTAKMGAQGDVALSVKPPGPQVLTVNVHQTSTTNQALRGYFRAQQVPGRRILKTCSLRNSVTGEVYLGQACLTSDAPLKIGEGVQNVEWSFTFLQESYTPGVPSLA